MGMFDKIKHKAGDLAGKHGDKLGEGVQKAGGFADKKTGGKYREQIDQGVKKAKKAVDDLGKRDNPA
jgi:MT0933-like antitoxin protein